MPELPAVLVVTLLFQNACHGGLYFVCLSLRMPDFHVSNLTIQSAGDRYYVCTDLMEKCHI